jgi:hypothetical protein
MKVKRWRQKAVDREEWVFDIHGTVHPDIFLYYNQLDAQFFEFIEYHCTCFGRSFLPSSGVQDCTYNVRYMSYRFVDCLLEGPGPLTKLEKLCI